MLAADYHWEGNATDRWFAVSAYVRNSLTGEWNQTVVVTGPISRVQQAGGSLSLRAACVHRDSVTKQERVFLLVGTLGVFTGVYDGSLDGLIRWDTEPEPLPPQSHETRPLAVVEAGGQLLISSGRYIFRRKDGPKPSYEVHGLHLRRPPV